MIRVTSRVMTTQPVSSFPATTHPVSDPADPLPGYAVHGSLRNPRQHRAAILRGAVAALSSPAEDHFPTPATAQGFSAYDSAAWRTKRATAREVSSSRQTSRTRACANPSTRNATTSAGMTLCSTW